MKVLLPEWQDFHTWLSEIHSADCSIIYWSSCGERAGTDSISEQRLFVFDSFLSFRNFLNGVAVNSAKKKHENLKKPYDQARKMPMYLSGMRMVGVGW